MEFLGVGPLELIFILAIILIVVGPRDMTKTARTIGRFLNKLYRSESWRTITEASRNLRTLPNRLAREAGLEDLDDVSRTLKEASEDISGSIDPRSQALEAWTTPPKRPQPKAETDPAPPESAPSEADEA